MTAHADRVEADANEVTALHESSNECVIETTTAPLRKPGNLGFDGRTFLTDAEHQTYLRRKPVRYVRKVIAPAEACSVCGEAESVENPLQVAHIVPFGLGIVHFKLTPEWLDSANNLRWAHRSVCNKASELTVDEVQALLVSSAVNSLQ